MQEHLIAVIGNANLDIVGGTLVQWPETGTETFLQQSDMRIGGSAANTALVLDRLATKSGLVAAAGSDLAGDMIADRFSRPHDRIVRIEGPSSVTFGILHPSAERTFFSTRGHLDDYKYDHVREALDDWPLEGAIVLLSGSFAMPAIIDLTASLLNSLKEQGAITAIDPGWPPNGWTCDTIKQMSDWVALGDHVLINDKELLGLTSMSNLDDAMVEMASLLGANGQAIIKCGKSGAWWVSSDGQAGHVAAPSADVFDTIGAGDAFNAGYLAAVARGFGTSDAALTGCRVATAVVREFPRLNSRLTLGGEEPFG